MYGQRGGRRLRRCLESAAALAAAALAAAALTLAAAALTAAGIDCQPRGPCGKLRCNERWRAG